jgi:prepilin-type N-terminal cleavage/methylation domain-containing protein
MIRNGFLSRRAGATPRGFTLVEILLWIAVASLAASVAYGLMTPYAQERKLSAGVERVVTALEYARDLARSERRPVAVRIVPDATQSTSANSLRVVYADDLASVSNPLTKSPYALDFRNDAHLRGVVVVSSNAGGDDALEFDARGTPGDEGNEFVLACGGMQMIVRVEVPTGRVVVEEPDGGKKE